MVNRQFPKPAEIPELLQFKKPELNGRKRRLEAAPTIEDLRRVARRRTPRAVFDYTDGAAEGELSLAGAAAAGAAGIPFTLSALGTRRGTSPRARSGDAARPGPSSKRAGGCFTIGAWPMNSSQTRVT